jgi:hypothetical protein
VRSGKMVDAERKKQIRTAELMIPLPLGLFVDGADFVSLREHGFDEVAADESAGAGHEDVGFAHKGMEKCKMLIKSGRRPRWLILNV